MEVTRVEVLRSANRVALPEPWLPAWAGPSGRIVTAFDFAFYKVQTDEGITGIGPKARCRRL